MEQLKEVYQYANQLDESESHFGPTIKLLVLSGLRNDALTNLKVQDLHIEKSLLCLNENSVTINTKHKVQLIPLPPILMSELIDHINKHRLQAEDKLLSGVEKVTPHGFRATISTLLSERGIDLNSIRFLLGHSEKDNLHFYIRRYGRHIQVLRRELTRLEEELTQENAEVICREFYTLTKDEEGLESLEEMDSEKSSLRSEDDSKYLQTKIKFFTVTEEDGEYQMQPQEEA